MDYKFLYTKSLKVYGEYLFSNMYILSGTNGQLIADTIAKSLDQPLVKVTIKRFPDTELYVKIDQEIDNEDVIIVQSTYPDENIIELLLLQNAVRTAGASHITTIIPYFGYSRQDKQFSPGEPVSAEVLSQYIENGIDRVITVDPHKEHILNFFNIQSSSVSAIPEIAKYLEKKSVNMVLAPDKGALPHNKEASAIIHCECDYIEKKRIDAKTVKMNPKNLQVKGKTVAIIDDIISTGGTMAMAINALKQQGAKKVYAACTHGLFIGKAVSKLENAGCDEIISTDTIQNKFSKVSVVPSILRVL
jgi:ribose-phosphate pyrophosphokinase